MKYIFKFFSAFLIISFIFGDFSLYAFANKKDDINFQQDRAVDSTDNSSTLYKTSSLHQEIDTLPPDLATTTKDRNSLEFQKIESAKNDYIKDEILIKYKNNKINLNTSSGKAAALNFVSSKSLENKEDLDGNNISVLKIKDGKTVEEKISELRNDSNIEYAEPNYRRYPAVISSNDTNKALLWGLDNTGQSVNGTSGTSDADIDAPEAWAISDIASSTSVIVAIIDSGIAYNHPDLLGNMWDGTNCKNENGDALGSCNHGYDYEDSDKTPLPSTSHGTHLAGIIAATKNNSKGVIGVAQDVKIMAIKYNFSISEEIKAIDFAIQNGAKIINASYGANTFSQSEYDAINRFKSAGGIFVAAAGNESTNNESTHFYPSDYNLDNIISVAATDQNDALASFSNYGATSVDVGAPGTNIYSTLPQETTALSEDFEAVTPPAVPSGWVKAGTSNNWGTYALPTTKVLYGDLAYPYANNANTTITSPTYDLGTGGANIDFWTKCDTQYLTDGWADYMALEFSSNGSTFTQVLQWDEAAIDSDTNPSDGAVYHFENLSIPTQYLTSNFKFRLRWVTNSSDNDYDGCLVDDVIITKLSDGSDEQYGYEDGTSMSTPYVAGLAALIKGYNSGLTYSQVKNIILTTGDDKASLSGKTISGKRINAYNALVASNPAKAITAFTIPLQVGSTTINESAKTVTVTMPYGTDVTALIPSITITGASVSPASGVAHNFTATSTYTVTANDASTQAYSVIVTFTPNPAKAITSFTIPTQVGSTTINESAHTIALNVPYGTSLTALVPSIIITGASVSPASGVANNFTATTTYTVTAADASTQAYTANVTVNAPSSVAVVTSETYTVDNASSTITNIPYATASSTFLTTITKGESNQTWNISNIANPIVTGNTLVVTAQDGITTKTYTVTVNAPSSIATVTSATYTIDNASSTITNIPFGTASSTFLTALTKGESHQIWNIDNISNPVLSDNTLVVTAQDGTTIVTYTITVNAPSSNTTLQNLTISNGILSPSFSTSTTAYTVSVSNSISSVTVTPTQNEFLSTIKVNGATTTSGSASSPISLIVGSNSISIEVLAEDNTSTGAYTITVTRAVASGGGGGGGGGGRSAPAPVVVKGGDANGDNKIDKYDFSLIMSNWGKTGSNVCDFNSDEKVDKYDFSLLMLNWSK